MICSRRLSRKTFRLPLKRLKFISALVAKLAGLNLSNDSLLAVNIVGPRIMRRINREFLGHDYLTDVICFDYRDESTVMPGDVAVEIFLSPDMAVIQAAERPTERSPESELLLYLTHGILHATGELDSTPEEKHRMRRKEKSVLRALAKNGIKSING